MCVVPGIWTFVYDNFHLYCTSALLLIFGPCQMGDGLC